MRKFLAKKATGFPAAQKIPIETRLPVVLLRCIAGFDGGQSRFDMELFWDAQGGDDTA